MALDFSDQAAPVDAGQDNAAQPNFADTIRTAGEKFDMNAVSPKGARSDMQVEPYSAKDPGYGVKPAQNDSLEEYHRVGVDLANAYRAHYGDDTLGAIAYDAGPERLDQWIAKYGDPRTGKISMADFLAKIPYQETKDYAGRIQAAMKGKEGAPDFSAQAKPLDFSAQAAPVTQKPKTLWEHIEDLMGGAQLPNPKSPQDTWLQEGKKFIQNVPAMLEKPIGGLIEGLGAPGNVPNEPGLTVTDYGALPPSETHVGGGAPVVEAAGKKIAQQAEQKLEANAPNVPGASFQGFANTVGQGAVEMAPALAAAAITKNPAIFSSGAATTAYGNTYADARQRGATPEQAQNEASVSAAATSIGFKLFEFSPFRHFVGKVTNEQTGAIADAYKQTVGDTIKNLVTQGMAIQPAVNVVEHATDNILNGKDVLDGLPGPILQSGLANTVTAGLGHIAARRSLTLGEWQVPQNEAYPYDPSAHFGSAPPIEPEGGGSPGSYRPGGGAAAAQLAGPPPPAGSDIGLRFPDGSIQRATVQGYGANGSTIKVQFEDGSTVEHLTSEVMRDRAPPPPARFEAQPEPPKPYQRQLGPDEGAAPPFGEAPPEAPGKRAAAKIAARQPQQVMDPQAIHALDLADRLEVAATDPGNPMSTNDRMAALMQVARIRQQFQPQGEESQPGAYKHPGAGEPAQDLGALGVARAAQPENYQDEYARQPFAPSHVSRETLDLAPYRPMDLLQFLGSRGGIQGDDPYVAGNLQAMDAHKKFLPNSGMLVRKTGGMPLDKAREAAEEAGYGVGYNNFETTDDLLDAIRDQLAGKDVFSHTENGGIEAAQAWQAHKAVERMGPQDEQDDRDNIAELRDKAEHYGIPVGEDWSAEDLMAAVGEREAVMAERAHDSDAAAKHLADVQELNIDHHLAVSWPEYYGPMRGEGVADEDPFGHAEEPAQGQPATQPEAAAPVGEHGGEGTPGKETGPPGDRGRPGDRGEAAPAQPEAEPEPVEPAIHRVQLAEENVNPEPSPAQVSAGNYKHGHVDVGGVPVSIETPAGAQRRGVGPDGKPWAVTLEHPYGYVKRTEGADGEQVDAWIGPHPDSPDAFVIDQIDPKTGGFDEHKAVLGARTEEQAREIYDAGYSDGSGPTRAGAITAMPIDEFRQWAESGPKREPLAYQPPIIPSLPAQDVGRQAAEDLRTAAATADPRAEAARDEIEQTIDENVTTHLPEALDDAAWHPAIETEEQPAAAGRPDEAGEPERPVAGEAEVRAPSAAEPAGGGHPGGEGTAAREAAGVTVKENPDRNGVEVRFKERPTDEVLGKLKSAGFRWSKPQKLWYAKRSDRTLAVANGLKATTEKPISTPEVQKAEIAPDLLADKKAKIKALMAEAKPLGDKGDLTAAEGRRYEGLIRQVHDLRFDITGPLTLENVKPAVERMSTLSPAVVLAAHRDLFSNRAAHDAIMTAATGASFASNTAVDKVVLGQDAKITPVDFYRTFDRTRAAIRAQYGDTVKLYRAEGHQIEKPTKNWATTREYAKQFGENIVSKEIPVDDILAVNVGHKGGYHEVIVGKKPAERTFTTTPGAIAAEHAAEVSSLEAQGTARAGFRHDLERTNDARHNGIEYQVRKSPGGHGWEVSSFPTADAKKRQTALRGEGLSRDQALANAFKMAFPDGTTPTEAAADAGAAEAARAEMDASTYQPAAMPITAAAPPPKKPVDLFSVGDAVQPRPEFEADLPPRSGDRYVTDVSPDGRQVTLDGGAILPSTSVEPTLGHGLQGPISERAAGQRPEAVPRTGEVGENRPAPPGEDRGSLRPAGRPAGGGAERAGRTPTRSPGAETGRGARDVPDAGLPAEREPGTSGRPDAHVRGENFSIQRGEIEEGRGPKAKATDNLAAIRLVKRLIAEDRTATRDEQAILARYVGWGGLSGAFQGSDGEFGTGFEDIGRELKAALTEPEYQTAARSTQYAHYTAENVIRSMWEAVSAMGFRGGSVFEPGMGVGHFLGMMPPDIAAASQYEGIELDHLTAAIASHIYPRSGVRQADFTQTPMPENAFDLVIGNPPFSDLIVKADPKYAARGFMLHDYFFAKSLDSVRPGGLLAFVTSAGTMNKLHPDARSYLGQRAEFLGGVRLPSNAFKKNAGTEVTTDVLFFQKRPEPLSPTAFAAEPEASWVQTVQRDLPNAEGKTTKGNVSRYFSEHPEMVLGREGFFDKLYKDRYAVHADDNSDLTEAMQRAMATLPRDIYQPPATPLAKAEMDFASKERKDGSFYMKDGQLMQYQDGVGKAVQRRGAGVEGGVTAADHEKIQRLIPIRDALRDVFAHDLAERPAEAAAAREQLNRVYDAFTRKYGPINKADYQYRRPNVIQQEYARAEAREVARDRGEPWREGSFNGAITGMSIPDVARLRADARTRHGAGFDEGSFDAAELPDIVIEKRPNIDPFMDDQESYRLRAIEDYNEKTGLAQKRRVFFESVLTKEQEPILNSANDGVLWSLNKLGRFDVEAIAKKMGRERADIIGELGDKVFKVPGTDGTYQTSDEYLSGDILNKLDEARAAAQHDPEVRRNIPALEAAVPAPLAPSEISMTLGMPWIPPQYVEDFARSHLRIGEARIRHNKALGGWTIKPISDGSDNALWAVEDLSASKLMSAALNRKPPRIYKEIHIPGEGKRSEFDPVGTQAAIDKYEAMRTAFQDWIASEPGRADELASTYNNSLNRSVLRVYDGSYLTTPGIASDWSWRPHQKRVVARIIQSGNTYMGHAVGAGKTSAMIGAGMEMRRLGLVKKPMYVVPNHMLGQFTKEFYEQYPTAKIMVADERRFHTSRRKQFIANAAQSDMDAIIITHSAFGKIPMSADFQNHLIQEDLDQIAEAMQNLDKHDDRLTIKKLENQKEKLEQKLRGAMGKRKDQTNTFEEMGVDFVFTDEAHMFRKLSFATRQSGLKGVDPNGSEAAFDLYSKIRYLESKRPGRATVLASGTPVTNTMAELFSISRYLQRADLQDRGIDHFDSWASTFGDTKQELEQTADGGYQSVTRFAKFVNIPELFKMVGQVMDIVTPAQLDQYVVRPKLKGGKRTLNLAPRTEFLDEYQNELAHRMQAIRERRGPPKKGDDIMLTVIGDGRKAAIDPRFLMGTGAEAEEMAKDSKLSQMIDNVYKIWERTKDVQFYDLRSNYQTPTVRGPAAQMIFSNLGINPKEEGGNGFSTYGQIKAELLRRGVPPTEIAFIRDYKSSVARQKLFNDMNEGKIRILVGSTQKMGTGVNAQKRLYAIHNLDPLWYPADDEQRVGRGLRQGNMNPEIEIHDYSTKGTYDASMWQMMGRKARFIEQFFRGDPELRDMEDLGEASQYEQASAMSTADPRVMQLTELRQNLDRAVRRESAHDREQYTMRQQLKSAHENVGRSDRMIPIIQADIAKRKLPPDDEFRITVAGKKFDKHDEAVEALKAYIADKWPQMGGDSHLKLGEYAGFPFAVYKSTFNLAEPGFYFDRSDGKESDLSGHTPRGAVRSLINRVAGFEDEVKYLEKSKAEAQAKIKSIESQMGKPFTGGDEIKRLRQEVRELEAALAPKKPEEGAQGAVKAQVPKGPDEEAGAALEQNPAPQTETPEFKAWFGDSKVVDVDGKPLVVYHGTARDVEAFDKSRAMESTGHPSSGLGFFFTPNADLAGEFAAPRIDDTVWPPKRTTGEGGNIVPAYLSIKRPKVLTADEWRNIVHRTGVDGEPEFRQEAIEKINDWRRRLEVAGADGVHIVGNPKYADSMSPEYGHDNWVAFHPEQIKSAIGNVGSFDANNPDIRAQEPSFPRTQPTIWADIGGTKRLAPDFYARMPRIPSEGEAQLIEQINRIVKQIAPGALVIPAKDLTYRGKKIWGAMYVDGPRNVIAWAMEGPSPVNAVHHEAVHWLRNVGFFRPDEWETLSNAAINDNWLNKHNIHGRYPDSDFADKIEEAIAEEYASWAERESTPPPPVRTIFGRLRELFSRIRKYLRSLYGDTVKADDIFSKIMSGEIGSREPLDKWKPSEEVFAQAAKTPEGPPETPAEGRDYIDATTNDLAEHMRGKGPGTYERTLQHLTPSRGPEIFKRANWAQREFVGPRTIAEVDTKSGRLWAALQREEDEASTRLHDLRDNIRGNFLKLPRENQDRVNAVMELDRLENRTRTDDGRSILARNTNFPDARGSKPGDALILTPEETKAYFGLQRMYREAWDNIMEGSGRRMGWSRPWSPAMADNFKEIERAMSTADGQRNRKAFQRIHDVLTAMEEQRRAAYMPLMRFGDYYFSVTPKYDKESTGGFPESVWFSLAERPSFQYAAVDPMKMVRFEDIHINQVPDYAKSEMAMLQAKYPGKDFRINHGYLLSKPDMLRQMSIPAVEKLMMLLESGVMDRMKAEASMEGFANKGAAYKKAKEDWGNLYEELVDAVRDEMYEQLKAGFKKRSRTVPGYSGDWNRVVGTYMGWTSRHVARQIHSDTIERLHDDIQASHPDIGIKQFWRDWKQDDDSPMSPLSRIGIAANQLGFMWTMAMNPASTVSIAMHGPTYAIPTLGTGIGVPKAAAAFTKAYGEATTAIRWDDKHGAVIDTMKVGKTPDERAFLKSMEASGYLHAKGAEDIRSMAEKASAIWGDYTPHAQQAMDILSSNIAVADQANRVAASLAAYRLARDGNLGHMNAIWAGNQVWRAISGEEGVSPESMGKFLLNQSVGEWGGRSRSKFGRSFIGRMGSSLHGFQIRFLSNWLKQLFRQGGAGRIAAAWSMAALWAAAGLQGLPFVQDAENGIDEIWKALKGKDPMLAWRLRAMLVDTGLGKTGADIVMRGPLSTATGIDFASRLGFGDVITRDIAPWFGAANEMALTFPSIVAGSLRAAKARAGSHQPAAAAAAFLPAALRHPAQAVIDAEHGVKSQPGKTMYVPARKFTGADEAKEAAGFTPLDVARAREHAEFRYRAKNAHGKRPPDTVPR